MNDGKETRTNLNPYAKLIVTKNESYTHPFFGEKKQNFINKRKREGRDVPQRIQCNLCHHYCKANSQSLIRSETQKPLNKLPLEAQDCLWSSPLHKHPQKIHEYPQKFYDFSNHKDQQTTETIILQRVMYLLLKEHPILAWNNSITVWGGTHVQPSSPMTLNHLTPTKSIEVQN